MQNAEVKIEVLQIALADLCHRRDRVLGESSGEGAGGAGGGFALPGSGAQ